MSSCENKDPKDQEIEMLKAQVQKYYNESHYYKDKCLELYEKLQEHQIEVDISFMRVAI
jgi:hypothetical protein